MFLLNEDQVMRVPFTLRGNILLGLSIFRNLYHKTNKKHISPILIWEAFKKKNHHSYETSLSPLKLVNIFKSDHISDA